MPAKLPSTYGSMYGAGTPTDAIVGAHGESYGLDATNVGTTPLTGLMLLSIYFGPTASANDIDNSDTWTAPAALKDRIVTYGVFPEGITTSVWNVVSYAKNTGVFTFGCQTGSTTNKAGWLVLGVTG